MPSQLPSLPPGLAALSARLSQIGFERTRRALAGLVLSAFATIFFLVSLNAPDGFGRVFVALSVCYGVAFVGVVAEWFWGRWFATGLAWSGVMLAIAVMSQAGWMPAMALFGGLHLTVAVALMGKKMMERYDLQEGWRERFKIDEYGVARLRKAVTSAAASLPSMIVWVLAPKPDALSTVGSLAALVLTVAGLRGLIRLRSWGVLALGGAGILLASLGDMTRLAHWHSEFGSANTLAFAAPGVAFICLAVAVLPFVRPMARFLRRAA
jgi:hypothetical protein